MHYLLKVGYKQQNNVGLDMVMLHQTPARN